MESDALAETLPAASRNWTYTVLVPWPTLSTQSIVVAERLHADHARPAFLTLINLTPESSSVAFRLRVTGWVEVRPSRLSGTRRIVDVVFSYTNRNTDVTEKYFVRVDVTEEWPFLVTKMSPYYDR
jgi:hypothetical protein